MSRYTLAFTALLGLGLALPANAQTQVPGKDTGSMAYPAPVPQGNASTTSAAGAKDTGSAAYPKPAPAGDLSTTATGVNRPTDTGNMAYPAPLPQGNVAGSTVPK